MLPAHYHPRAHNFVVAVEGTTQTYMIAENGARVASEVLTPGKATLFPMASIHTMQNLGLWPFLPLSILPSCNLTPLLPLRFPALFNFTRLNQC